MKLRRSGITFTVCAAAATVAAPRTAVARDAPADCAPEDCDDGAAGGVPELAPQPELPEDDTQAASSTTAPASPAPPTAAPPPPGMLSGKMELTSGVPDGSKEAEDDETPSPWGMNLRLQGLALGSGQQHRDAGLGGFGISLRRAFRPSVVLDLGLDTFGGTDYNGYDRTETSLSVSALWFLNPDAVIRTYVLAGLHASVAQVDVAGDDRDWTYFGAHAGLGLDFPLSERVSLDVDVLGFLRGRTDSRAEREPEFTDGFGNLSNTSGGGVFRGGVSLYF